MSRHVVLDTNCVLQCFSQRSRYYIIWKEFIEGKYILCVSNDILEEYEEIIASHVSPYAAQITVETILRASNVLRVDTHFHFNMITADPDDNKFVDCAIAANADYIVSEDSHFNELKQIPFPHVEVLRLEQFYQELCNHL